MSRIQKIQYRFNGCKGIPRYFDENRVPIKHRTIPKARPLHKCDLFTFKYFVHYKILIIISVVLQIKFTPLKVKSI